ncbi:MAG: hypothetical protein ABR511_05390 [Acidimicrobiales bacterium]
MVRALYWRSEILRVLYWLRGEGLGDLVDVPMIRRYLEIGAPECRARLAALVADGDVVRDGSWYSLSPARLADAEIDVELTTYFADLARPEPGLCSDECWCRMSSAEEDACSGRRPLQIQKGDRRP